MYMHESNAKCTGADGSQEPVPMFHGRSLSSRHEGGDGSDARYTHAVFTHTECPRTQSDGKCGVTGEQCNAPLYVILDEPKIRQKVEDLLNQ